nr:WW domain-binding protein 4 isoform X2 [Megalopta genalis]
MADYWKSQGRKFCDFCKCWIADNKPSIDFHEGGKKHKDNVSKRLKEIHKNSAKQAKQNKKMEDDIRKMESAAMAAYLKDVENNTRDMTADRIIEEKRNRSDVSISNNSATTMKLLDRSMHSRLFQTPSGNRATTIPGTTSGVKCKTQQFLHEIDPCDPTLSRTSRQYQQQPRVPAKPENKAQGKSKANKGKGKGRKAQEEDRSAKPVRKLWYEARSPEGYTYYWHIETNETAWDPPEEGYMTFAEQEEEAREQALQEELLEQLKQEEEIANKEILEEKRANAERERSRQLRKSRSESNRLDETTDTASATRDGQKTREEKREEEQRPYRRDYSGSCQKSHPYGAWQTVRVVETKPVDLQLPRLPQKTTAPVAAFDKAEPPPPQRTFKEKTVTRVDTGDSDGDYEPTAFKKRKIGNKNVRKRLNDD